MRFGNFLIGSIIVHLLQCSGTFGGEDQPSSASTSSPSFANPPSKHLDRLEIRLNRFRSPDRRLFFSFNQLLLSMLAPRLMRYQFDLMIQSVVAELFKKILVPVIGSAAGASAQSGGGGLLGPIGSLLRLRQAASSPTVVTTPRTTTTAPNLDVQRLLDNAHKLITIQSLLRNNNNQNNGAGHRVNNVSKKVNNRPGNIEVTTTAIIATDRQNNSNSGHSDSKAATSDHPIQFAISAKEFLNFIQNNLKPSSVVATTTVNYNTSAGDYSAAAGPLSSSSVFANANNHNNNRKQSPPQPRNNRGFKQKAKLEDFKLSHLTYIDTEVPNYGNQLLIRDHEDSLFNEGLKNPKPDPGLLSLLAETNGSGSKNSDEVERANRWNDVLVNMRRTG